MERFSSLGVTSACLLLRAQWHIFKGCGSSGGTRSWCVTREFDGLGDLWGAPSRYVRGWLTSMNDKKEPGVTVRGVRGCGGVRGLPHDVRGGGWGVGWFGLRPGLTSTPR